MECSDTIVHNHEVIVRIDEVRVPPDTRSSTTWIGLGEASRLLGIAPGTLRRWADEGRIPVFTTPGGHRRFARSTLSALLPAARTHRPSLARLGASPERMARAYHARSRTGMPGPAAGGRLWIAALADELGALARRRGLDTREATALLADAEAATDRLLVSMMTGHAIAAGLRQGPA